MLSVTEAEHRIAAVLSVLGSEPVPLAQALGRVLRAPLAAERDQPPFDRVMMDGIALDSRAGPGSRVLRGSAAAGAPQQTLADAGDCIEVMTGAPLPAGCDCVVPVEALTFAGNDVQIAADAALAPGTFIHSRGNDHARGAMLAAPGRLIDAPLLAIAATAGAATLTVARRPRVAIITSGDELVEPGIAIEPHQIRRSNHLGMAAVIDSNVLAEITQHHVRDDEQAQRDCIATALATSDMLVLSGGVSKGSRDYVAAALEATGVQQIFHRVAQRPGKPMWFGRGPAGQVVFALPGNPVAAVVGARRYVVPALKRMLGQNHDEPTRVRLAEDFEFAPALNYFLPCALQAHEAVLTAYPAPPANSGDLTALADSDGFVELPAGEQHFAAGALLHWYAWQAGMGWT